jgi:hypothetical protein
MRSTLFIAGLGVVGACVLALGFSSQAGAWRDLDAGSRNAAALDQALIGS